MILSHVMWLADCNIRFCALYLLAVEQVAIPYCGWSVPTVLLPSTPAELLRANWRDRKDKLQFHDGRGRTLELTVRKQTSYISFLVCRESSVLSKRIPYLH